MSDGETLRIDKLLWYLRLAKSRSAAQVLVEKGHIRLNGRRIDKSHTVVRREDVLTVPLGAETRVIRITTLPARRGPASEAQSCWEMAGTAGTARNVG